MVFISQRSITDWGVTTLYKKKVGSEGFWNSELEPCAVFPSFSIDHSLSVSITGNFERIVAIWGWSRTWRVAKEVTRGPAGPAPNECERHFHLDKDVLGENVGLLIGQSAKNALGWKWKVQGAFWCDWFSDALLVGYSVYHTLKINAKNDHWEGESLKFVCAACTEHDPTPIFSRSTFMWVLRKALRHISGRFTPENQLAEELHRTHFTMSDTSLQVPAMSGVIPLTKLNIKL